MCSAAAESRCYLSDPRPGDHKLLCQTTASLTSKTPMFGPRSVVLRSDRFTAHHPLAATLGRSRSSRPRLAASSMSAPRSSNPRRPVNGVAQREIQQGAWLHVPDLTNVGHHTVVANETLAGLAARWYGDDHPAEIIELANNPPTGSEVTPGQVLIQPELNRLRHMAAIPSPVCVATSTATRTCKPGSPSSRRRTTSASPTRSSATRRCISRRKTDVG